MRREQASKLHDGQCCEEWESESVRECSCLHGGECWSSALPWLDGGGDAGRAQLLRLATRRRPSSRRGGQCWEQSEWGVRRRARFRIHVASVGAPSALPRLAARRRSLPDRRGCSVWQHAGALRDQGPSSGVVVPSAVSGWDIRRGRQRDRRGRQRDRRGRQRASGCWNSEG